MEVQANEYVKDPGEMRAGTRMISIVRSGTIKVTLPRSDDVRKEAVLEVALLGPGEVLDIQGCKVCSFKIMSIFSAPD